MSEHVFRCDYCGTLADIDNGVIFWTEVDTLDNGDILFIPAVYCGAYCGRTASTRAGTGRG